MDTPMETTEVGVQGAALTMPFSLSVLTVTKGHASKQLLAGANGLPIKGQGSLAISAGMIEHVQVPGLAGLQALLTGIRQGSGPGPWGGETQCPWGCCAPRDH